MRNPSVCTDGVPSGTGFVSKFGLMNENAVFLQNVTRVNIEWYLERIVPNVWSRRFIHVKLCFATNQTWEKVQGLHLRWTGAVQHAIIQDLKNWIIFKVVDFTFSHCRIKEWNFLGEDGMHSLAEAAT
jgi:hypothetical protein